MTDVKKVEMPPIEGEALDALDACFFTDRDPHVLKPKIRSDNVYRFVVEHEKTIRKALSRKPLDLSGVWKPAETAPRDGKPFYARFKTPYRWLSYKKDARRQGYPEGRWQEMTDYGGWKNTENPPLEWCTNEEGNAAQNHINGGE